MSIDIIASAASSWLWETYGETIVTKAAGALKKQWSKFNWGKAANTYRQRIKDRYGITRILGLANAISLEGIYTDVFLLDKPTAFQRHNIEQLKQDPTLSSSSRVSAIRIVSQNERLLILGKPGSGKTTFLRHVAILAADGKIDKIPIFVSLKEWADSELDLLTFIVKQFDICMFPNAVQFVEQILQKGNALVLFDGLDEISKEKDYRLKSTETLRDFAQKHIGTQCLITCRTAANEYLFEHFVYVEIADFNDNQVKVFAGKWFQNQAAKRDRFISELTKEKHKNLNELARIPLLLTLLCLAFEETSTFPNRRADLYEEAIQALLKKWDIARNVKRDEIYRNLSLGRKYKMFEQLAIETFENDEYFIRQDDIEKRIVSFLHNVLSNDVEQDIDGEVILKAIEAQHGIIVERAHRIYSFAHRTFQEYFSAKHVAENPSDQNLMKLLGHTGDFRWYEIILLVASLLDNTDRFFELFGSHINYLLSQDDQLIQIIDSAYRISKPLEELNIDSIIEKKDLDFLVGRKYLSKHTENLLDVLAALKSETVRIRCLGILLIVAGDDLDEFISDKDKDMILGLIGKQQIHKWHPGEEGRNKLISYIKAIHWYLDCLELANKTNRLEKESLLLLHP